MSTQVLGINETGDMSIVHLAEENDTFIALSNLSPGKLVATDDDGKVHLAMMSGDPATGFVLDTVVAGDNVKVWRVSQLLTGLSDLVTGKMYYLNENGNVSSAPPAFGSGYLMQKIGIATSTSSIAFAPQPAVLYS
jgi:hypothetical protein